MNQNTYDVARSSLEIYPVASAWEEQQTGKKRWDIKVPYGRVTVSYRFNSQWEFGGAHSLTGTYTSDPSPFTDNEPYQFGSAQEVFHNRPDSNTGSTFQTFFARVLHKLHDGIRHHMILLSLYEVLYDKKLLDYPSWTTHITKELERYRGTEPNTQSKSGGMYRNGYYIQMYQPNLYATMWSLRFNAVYRNPYGGDGAGTDINEPKFVLDTAKKFVPNDRKVDWGTIALTKESRYSMDRGCVISNILTGECK